ncbi:MAG TPA: hypothetical protein VF762_02620, partial [Blastocatellia bacterium]
MEPKSKLIPILLTIAIVLLVIAIYVGLRKPQPRVIYTSASSNPSESPASDTAKTSPIPFTGSYETRASSIVEQSKGRYIVTINPK